MQYYVNIKHCLRNENKINENQLFSYCEVFRCIWNVIKNNEKVVLHCVKLTNPLSFKLDSLKVDQRTGSKWLIHDTKHRKGNQLQSLELPYRIS